MDDPGQSLLVSIVLLQSLQIAYQLQEGLSIQSEDFDSRCQGDDVCRSDLFAQQSTLPEEISLIERPDLPGFRLTFDKLSDLHLTRIDDEEGVSLFSLSDDVVAGCIVVLVHHIGDFRDSVFRQVFEDRHLGQEVHQLIVSFHSQSLGDHLEDTSVQHPQLHIGQGLD